MRAGKLDRQINIERLTETITPSGGSIKAWQVIATVRTELVQQSATEFLTGFGEAESGTAIFKMRYLPDITTADRVVYGGVVYDLKEIKEIGRRRGMELRVVATS